MAIPPQRSPSGAAVFGLAAALVAGLVRCSSEQVVLSRHLSGSSSVGGAPGVGVGGTGTIGICGGHADCPAFSLCQDGQCVSCPAPPALCSGPCAFNFFPLFTERNGCTICECVAPSECLSDLDCQPWEICYPGAQCEPGCTDPSCCAGNQCAQPGCQPMWVATSCVVAGCPSGTSCLSECDREECDCNGVDWVCVGSIGDAGATSCAWNCAP